MVKIYRAFFVIVMLISSVVAQEKKEAVEWQTDYTQALALSREAGKPLLLDFTAVWCAPCRFMDEHFWTRTDVVETSKSFVAVKLDYDKERSLAGRFRVRGLPYIAFADPIGNLITYRKGFGAEKADELNEVFNELPKDFSPLKRAYAAVELKKNDGPALLEIADFYQKSGMLILSNDFYERANRTYEVNKSAENRERIAATIGLNLYAVGEFQRANVALENYLKIYPAGEYEEKSIVALIAGYANLGSSIEAEKHLAMLKKKFPASKDLMTATKAVSGAKKSGR